MTRVRQAIAAAGRLLANANPRSAAWRGAAIGLVVAAACWLAGSMPLIESLENRAFDECFVIRGARPTSAKTIIVAIDDKSIEQTRKPLAFLSPELAEVIAYLKSEGAAAIGVDFLLPGGETTMKHLLPGAEGDAETMGQAVGTAGNVVLPLFLAVGMAPPFEWQAPSSRPWADLGAVDFTVDADSCIRRQKLVAEVNGQRLPSFALAAWIKAHALPRAWLDAPQLTLDGRPIPLDSSGALRINYVGPAGSIPRVPFYVVLAAAREKLKQPSPPAPLPKGEGSIAPSPPAPLPKGEGSFAPSPPAPLPKGEGSIAPSPPAPLPKGEGSNFKDAIVLIGTVADGYKDNYPVPYTGQSLLQELIGCESGRMMPGVEIHANTLATLADRAFIATPWWLSTPLTLAVVGVLLGIVLMHCSLELGLLLAVVHHLVWRGLVAAAFVFGGWHVETVPMLLLGGLLYAAVFALRWRWIRRMMGLVKSEAVARALESGEARLDRRGRQREISVLFCDIRDFTAFAERHSPQEVVGLLNAFFSVAAPAIESNWGTLNQYIGDAMMVIFGAPREQSDHAARAVRAAEEIVRRVHANAALWRQLGAEGFRVGVGVHSGPAVLGAIGSPRRLDYTAIGDTVNSAARIEAANKELRSELLISAETFAALPGEMQTRLSATAAAPLALSVKGKQRPLTVYRIA